MVLSPSPPLPQAPSEYETSPEQLFYRIAHLNRGQQYLLWVAAVTSAGRGNGSEKVTIEPAGKGERLGLGRRGRSSQAPPSGTLVPPPPSCSRKTGPLLPPDAPKAHSRPEAARMRRLLQTPLWS